MRQRKSLGFIRLDQGKSGAWRLGAPGQAADDGAGDRGLSSAQGPGKGNNVASAQKRGDGAAKERGRWFVGQGDRKFHGR